MRPERVTIRLGPVVISLRFRAQPSTARRSDGGINVDDDWPRDRQEFAKAVLNARNLASLSQKELAAKVGVSEVTIRNIETGRTQPTRFHREWLIAALQAAGQDYPPKPRSQNQTLPGSP